LPSLPTRRARICGKCPIEISECLIRKDIGRP
jgi:hypothetical protein